jgi:pSer/pThr/pTyr-binding forkhead associated (FHA) protein
MDVKLILQKGGAPAQTFRLRSDEMVIGRQKGCGVRVPSALVSRQHCLLSSADDLVWVEDLSSANGTHINGRRIGQREVLRPGDKLTVGPVTFVVQYQLSEAAVQRLLREGEEQADVVAVPMEEGFALEDQGDVEVVVEDETGPLVPDEAMALEPADPMEALRQIEQATSPAEAGEEPVQRPAKRTTKRAKLAPKPADLDEVEVLGDAPSEPRRVKLAEDAAAAAEEEPMVLEPVADDESTADDGAAPDASVILGHKNWQMPTGENIRDILAKLEKGKKA